MPAVPQTVRWAALREQTNHETNHEFLPCAHDCFIRDRKVSRARLENADAGGSGAYVCYVAGAMVGIIDLLAQKRTRTAADGDMHDATLL